MTVVKQTNIVGLSLAYLDIMFFHTSIPYFTYIYDMVYDGICVGDRINIYDIVWPTMPHI